MGGFSYAVGSDEEKKLNALSGFYSGFDVGFEGVEGFVISVEHSVVANLLKYFIASYFRDGCKGFMTKRMCAEKIVPIEKSPRRG